MTEACLGLRQAAILRKAGVAAGLLLHRILRETGTGGPTGWFEAVC